ncbi:DUF605-domain-containing protein [Lophiostoma macrostomum CBS 122681]|uniref:DUF605-domain-containing protein n=1 Tax=Lophiostoma macrostomum CBS 122681 TaxID=1314788 RepID=A0A6A6TS33_9PLEO|nr:DUF605-domain-containing protein [Lophiostoma macrostomum CBS 122681]
MAISAAVPSKLKDAGIAQAAKRAVQLEQFRPIVTYWLRYYMIQKVISKGLHLADQECTAYASDLMEDLEQTKAQHPTEDAIHDETAAYAYCEQFALKTFTKGDNEIRANKVTVATVDTLTAASTFLELLSIWKDPPEAEIQAKLKYAKYHALRITKAIKAGEDPNLSNPKQPTPPALSPAVLDPNDPEVQRIAGTTQTPSTQNPYQPYVESAPDTSTQPSPTFSAAHPASPPNLPSAPQGYAPHTPAPVFSSHQDVSPISQPGNSRNGSVASVGGGYFPRVDVPTFTADNAAPNLPTAASIDEPMTSPFDPSSLPQAPQPPPQPSQTSDPSSFYQMQTSPPPPPLQQPTPQAPPTQPIFQAQQSGFASPPPTHPQQPPFAAAPSQHAQQPPPNSVPPQQHFANPYAPAPSPMQSQPTPQQFAQPIQHAAPMLSQGPFNTDDQSVLQAEKHAKWAISALQFEDVPTAVKELRVALRALGAN